LPPAELADIVREHGEALRARWGFLPERVGRAFRDIAACRTAALGGHLWVCDQCGAEQPRYNSCKNRHCPKCQWKERQAWVEARQDDLLPVPYFHVVFTVPHVLRPLFARNPRALYGLLFRAVRDTLLRLAADPKHLGAEIGVIAVLHTWSQALMLHPHVHCVVTGGGLRDDGTWTSTGDRFFLPVRVLGKLFRGVFLAALEDALRNDELVLPREVKNPTEMAQLLLGLRSRRWVVYSKPPFGSPEHVLAYLGRYTHRTAISNARIVGLDAGRVTFRHKRRSSDERWRDMTLDATEFLRRFALHVLPKGFVRIRYWGLLANRKRRQRLEACREQLGVVTPAEETDAQKPKDEGTVPGPPNIGCPECGAALLIRDTLPRQPLLLPGTGSQAARSPP
jgi:hypothetical protein